MRYWAVAGQNETLDRLGVQFERILYDSDRTQKTAEVARIGIERGVFVERSAAPSPTTPATTPTR